jgi:hypothetical protein
MSQLVKRVANIRADPSPRLDVNTTESRKISNGAGLSRSAMLRLLEPLPSRHSFRRFGKKEIFFRIDSRHTHNYTVLMNLDVPNRSSIHFILFVPVIDRFCGLVVRVPGYRTEMYFVSCEVQSEYIYMLCRRK